MARDNGGVIGVLNTPTATTASGVWALQDQYEAKRNGNWPLTPFVSPNSARFNAGSSDNLTRTEASGSRRKFTYSVWCKKSSNGSDALMIYNSALDENNQFYFEFEGSADSNDIRIRQLASASVTTLLKTSATYRDVSAWYHVVVAVDSEQATAANRVRLYVNGSEVTSFSTATYPSQNTDMQVNVSSSYTHHIGKRNNNSAYFAGYMSEFYFIDGQQLTPSSFGASNASGVWYPIPYAGSYGTNGFNLKFGNSASLGADSSPNGNNFTVNNLTSVDQSTDSTLNNFCTLNSLFPQNDSLAFTNGNLQAVKPSGSATGSYYGNFGVSAGKWYWEMKCIATGGTDQWIGIGQMRTLTPSGYPGNDTYCVAAGHANSALRYANVNVGSYTMASWTAGDIISIALDMTNSRVYWGKNGTWQNSGDPAAGTGAYTNATIFDGNFIMPVGALYQSNGDVAYNFGAGTTYAANSYADGAGYGNFSYAVPSGYYALCTANLNTYG